MNWILASQSPQRRAILERLGETFEVSVPPIDEARIEERDPVQRALVLAQAKAASVAKACPTRWVIGCDTLVESHNGELLEKPVDADDARRMLALHSGNTSTVHSALCLVRGEEQHCDISTALVRFKPLSSELVEWWIALGLWKGRSGAFQIEGEGQKLVEHLEGEFETVVGFPVACFERLRAQIEE